MSRYNMIMEVNRNLYLFAKYRYPCLLKIPFSWSMMAKMFEKYTLIIFYRVVIWKHSEYSFYKCNIDG